MNDIHWILIGVALGAVPASTLGRIGAAWLAKKAGLKPGEIQEYTEATDGDSDDSNT
jgi:threonine synthase